MNKILLALTVSTAVFCAVSCTSSKKIIYFQGADSLYKQAQVIGQQFELRLKPADNITVKISCSTPELLEMFKNDVLMGSQGSLNGNISGTANGVSNIYGYTIDSEGCVRLPLIGKLHLGGMTLTEASKEIENALISHEVILDPEVTVRMLNARVTVLGAVKNPGVVSLHSERNTIFDVLAQCGDIADDGLKQNIKVFRENNGERVMYTLDMTDVKTFKSPAYYMQQNDMVYVEPNKSKNIKNSAFYTFLGAGTTVIGAISSIIGLIFLIKK